MTKEEILEKHGRLVSGPALKAMDEYAKQQAIAFHDFAKNAPLRYSERKGNYIKYHTYTTDQIYNQFIEQQNKE